MTKRTSRAPMTRSETMARVRSKDTKPEMSIRRGLHARGYRYRLHVKDLPGNPDIVLRKFRAAIFVHGCYWHSHPGCGRTPKTRKEFWIPKFAKTRERDHMAVRALLGADWRVLIVWECCMVGIGRWTPNSLIDAIASWLSSSSSFEEFAGLDYVSVSDHLTA